MYMKKVNKINLSENLDLESWKEIPNPHSPRNVKMSSTILLHQRL